MSRSKRFALAVCVAALGLAAAPAAQAQAGAPIVVKQPKPRKLKYKGQVIHANRIQITVRSVDDERMLRTFRLSDELQGKMQEIIDKGGYQYGDKVEIQHVEGSDVALKIKGKPTKPPK